MQYISEERRITLPVIVNLSKVVNQKNPMAKIMRRARLIAFLPGLKSLCPVMPTRHLSSSFQNKQSASETDDQLDDYHQTIWPDAKLGLLGAKDPRFSLPGNVGMVNEAHSSSPHLVMASLPSAPDVLTHPLPQDRHIAILAQFLNSVPEIEEDIEIEEVYKRLESHSEVLEFIVQECPTALRKDLKGLFPSCSIPDKDPLTVFTLCQRTEEDMTGWSPAVEEEREELLEYFMSKAETICQILQAEGFWADFIDPSSGQAFIGQSNPNTTLFETDERFKHLGFDIEDLGCCKCIRHTVWGTHVFVGTIFTSAPADSAIIKQIVCTTEQTVETEK